MTDEDTMSETTRADTQTAKVVRPAGTVEEIYADGVLGALVRGGVLKIDCYTVVGFDDADGSEVRQLSRRIVLPTAAVRELYEVLKGLANLPQPAPNRDARGD